MFSVTSATRVLVATTPADLRGSFNLPASKITQIKEFTPAVWANAKGKLVAQAA